MAQKWAQKLQTDKVKEFSFFPNAYTPFEEDGFALPEMEMEWDGGDDGDQNKSDAKQSQVPQWVKNLSFTIGGVTIGAASIFALMAPPPAAPLPVCPQTTCTPAPAASPVPRPAGSGALRAAPAATSTSAASSTPAATSTQAATSSTGAI